MKTKTTVMHFVPETKQHNRKYDKIRKKIRSGSDYILTLMFLYNSGNNGDNNSAYSSCKHSIRSEKYS